MSQKGRIIKLLKERGQMGAFVYEIITPRPQGLGIAQYNARIKELRETGYNIRNVKPGHFVLEENPRIEEIKQIFTKELIESKQMSFN